MSNKPKITSFVITYAIKDLDDLNFYYCSARNKHEAIESFNIFRSNYEKDFITPFSIYERIEMSLE